MVDVVGRAIVTGVYNGKPFATEAELAAPFGVSRSAMREAVEMPPGAAIRGTGSRNDG